MEDHQEEYLYEPEDVRFFYFGRTHYHLHKGVITTVAILDRKTHMLNISFAFCSPKDHFNKEKGKQEAFQHMNEGEVYSVIFTGNSLLDVIDLFNSPKVKKPNKFRNMRLDEELVKPVPLSRLFNSIKDFRV